MGHRYDPETGLFYNSNGKTIGSYTRKYGRIYIDGSQVSLHRYAFFLMEGVWPEHEVDHINGDTKDNRWVNLRKCTRHDNAKNKSAYKTSATGYKGVYWDRGAYIATIQCNGKRVYLGRNSDPKVCAGMYNTAAIALHGEFASLNNIGE